MLDPRVYRVAFLPALLAALVAAFSLANRPSVTSEALEPDAFDLTRAFGVGAAPARDSLLDLARRFPDRRPGSDGDAALATRVEAVMAANGFETSRTSVMADGPDGRADLQTVIGVRAGVSSRRLVVMAHRDALQRGSAADLSATAALLEIARVSRGRELRKTLVLVSTSGGSIGSAAARRFAEESSAEADAALVLGDLAGTGVRRPWVVPWANRSRRAPLELQRTVEAAIRREVGADPGGARAAGQWLRLAVPYAFGEQAELQRAGLPAVLVGVSGEPGPEPSTPVDPETFVEFGRAALRALTALDAERSAPDTGRRAIVTSGKVLDAWVVRLLVGALLLPVLVAAVDAFARARRREGASAALLGWAVLWSVPFAAAYGWARLVDVVGLIEAPDAPVRPGVVAPDTAMWVAMASVAVLLVLAVLGMRGVLRRPDSATGGAGAAIGVVLSGCGIAAWARNPHAAALFLPALHAWFVIATADRPALRWFVVPALVAGVAPGVLVGWYYARALDLSAGELLWSGWLAVVGGHVSVFAVLGVAALLGCALALIAALRARGRIERPPMERPIATRGPLTYAGPGSLGGTSSALRD